MFTDSLLTLIPSFPPSAAARLVNASGLRRYVPGSMVIREGEPSGGIFVLMAGTVQLRMGTSKFSSRKWISLPPMSAPAVLGIGSCLLGEPSMLNISAFIPIEAIFIPQAPLLNVLREFPQAGLALSQSLADELAQTYSHLSQLHTGPSFGATCARVLERLTNTSAS